MQTPAFSPRSARPDDLRPLAEFVARLNASPENQCLFCAPASPLGVRSALGDPGYFPGGWEHAFVLAAAPPATEIVGVLGCQVAAHDPTGFLWGPGLENVPEAWSKLAPALLTRLDGLLTRRITRLEAFLHADNAAGLRFLTGQGFTLGPLTHLYLAARAHWLSALPSEYPPLCEPLRPAHEVAFARLHAETFPAHGTTPAAALLEGRGEERAIFAATDGLRLLGSVVVSVNHAPREGFVEYLAVKPTARGRGLGRRLLRTAVHWTFELQRLPQLALTVSDWRGGARRLYEGSGFVLHASGRGARRAR